MSVTSASLLERNEVFGGCCGTVEMALNRVTWSRLRYPSVVHIYVNFL